MTFRHLCEFFSQLEETTLRNRMVEILSSLFSQARLDDIGNLCYLLQGRVAPLYEAIEFGMADKMVIRSIAQGLTVPLEEVTKIFKQEGDLGEVVVRLKTHPDLIGTKHKPKTQNLEFREVYEVLYKVATASGIGSQEEKITLLSNLIRNIDPLSAKYVVRITLAKLRLGFSDMTILDAFSWMLAGTKEYKSKIEQAYNVRPDLGFIANVLKKEGIRGITSVIPQVGTPILMARAERMSNAKDILEKIGRCAIEPKYDGFRVQVHYGKVKSQNSKVKRTTHNLKLLEDEENKVKLFSRNLEDVTRMYPDIVEGVAKQISAKEAIFEGEAIAYNPANGEYLPFQETVQRKRKYDIEAKAKEIPLKLFAFDILYLDGQSLLTSPYTKRREVLTQLIHKGETIEIAQQHLVDDPIVLEQIFQDAITRGLEGVMTKKLEGIYKAGARDFNWIKYKRSYQSKLSDTIDVVVMGYDLGQGKRQGFGIGDFLIGVKDEKKEMFVTVAKIGTGLTDEEWKTMHAKCQKIKVKSKPNTYDVDKMMVCDIWVEPNIVVEIRADEITRSPVHTAGRIMGKSKSGSAEEVKTAGFALRFPRLERFREDKRPWECTTFRELEKMYRSQ